MPDFCSKALTSQDKIVSKTLLTLHTRTYEIFDQVLALYRSFQTKSMRAKRAITLYFPVKIQIKKLVWFSGWFWAWFFGGDFLNFGCDFLGYFSIHFFTELFSKQNWLMFDSCVFYVKHCFLWDMRRGIIFDEFPWPYVQDHEHTS